MTNSTLIVPVVRTCPFCGNATKIYITEQTNAAFFEYQTFRTGYIQDVPVPQFKNEHCKAIVREFLKTGYCLDCQALLFGGKKSHYKDVAAYKG